jgi:hypothetical protein
LRYKLAQESRGIALSLEKRGSQMTHGAAVKFGDDTTGQSFVVNAD